jgi:hypothetical protein
MSELWLFLCAVASHWVVLMTGGVITAALTAFQYWREKPFSWRFHKWVIGMFMAVACFLAWRDEYERAQQLLGAKADLEGRLQEREHRIEELRSHKGSEEHIRAIEAQLRSSQDALVAFQHSLQARRLSSEERNKFTDVLAAHDGQQFGIISVAAFPSCHECMTYVHDIAHAINSVPSWTARTSGNYLINVGFTGIGTATVNRGHAATAIAG